MALFHYKAVSEDGEVLEGEMQAASREVVIERLFEAGHTPLHAEPVAAEGAGGFKLFGRRRLSHQQIVDLTRELATLLNAGLPLDRALEILIDLAADERAAKLLTAVREEVHGGSTLADALEAQPGAFNRFYLNMVRAGEMGGALEAVLTRLSDSLERAAELKETINSALIYPAILVTVAGLSVVILLVYVVPQFTALFESSGKALPLPTQIVIAVGEGFRHYWWAMALAIVALLLFMQRQLSRPASRLRWDRWFLRMPLAGDLVSKVEAARFARTLGTLLGNGVPLLTALSIVRETAGNQVLAQTIDEVAESLKKGKGLSEPLMQAGHFPRLAVQLVRVGEETGLLEEMLLRVADIYDREVKTSVQRMLALLEPLLIVGLGLIIAAIIMSILVAILAVNELAF